jgi:hypothetical protein
MTDQLTTSQLEALRELGKGMMAKIVPKADVIVLIAAGFAQEGLNGPLISEKGRKRLKGVT